MIKRINVGLWSLLIILSIMIFYFPVHIGFDTSSVQSINVFSSFPIFAIIFVLSIFLIFILIFINRNNPNDVGRIALICIFTIIFVTFWSMISYYDQGGDSYNLLAGAKMIQQSARIPQPLPQLGYLEFPGLAFFTDSVSAVTGLSIFQTAYLVRLFLPIVFSLALFFLYKKCLGNTFFASLATLLSFIAETGFRTSYRPDLLAYIYLVVALLLIVKISKKYPQRDSTVILAIIIGALTISYFMISVALIFIITSVTLVLFLKRQKNYAFPFLPILVISIIFVLSWTIYSAIVMLQSFGLVMPSFLDRFINIDFLNTPANYLEGTVGIANPFWAVVTRYLKWIGFYGFGTFLGAILLVRSKNIKETILAGGLLGVFILTVFATVASIGGLQFQRYLMYSFIFISPIILLFCQKINKYKPKIGKMAIALLFFLMITFSLPCFLINGSSIATNNVSPQEISAGYFLQENVATVRPTIYSNRPYGSDLSWYFISYANNHGPTDLDSWKGQDTFWQIMFNLVDGFDNAASGSLYVWHERMVLSYYQTFGVPVTDSHWQDLTEKIENNSDLVLDDSYVQIYAK
jgi:hypothetical protein